jgi:hypothetical protein
LKEQHIEELSLEKWLLQERQVKDSALIKGWQIKDSSNSKLIFLNFKYNSVFEFLISWHLLVYSVSSTDIFKLEARDKLSLESYRKLNEDI